MRICVFFNAYTRGMSGGDKRALAMVHYWLSRGGEVTVYAPESFRGLLEAEGGGAAAFVPTAGAEERGGLAARYLARTCRTRRLLPRDAGGAIFYSPSGFLPDVLPALWGRRRNPGSRWVSVTHHIVESWRTRPGSRLWNWAACREQALSMRFVRRADLLLTENPLLRDWFAAHGFPMERVRMVGIGIDLAAVDAAAPRGDYDAVFLARLAASKGVFELPEIWERVTRERPGARLAVIGQGDGETGERLRAELDRRGLGGSVALLGFLPNETAYGLVRGAKLFLLPSHEEGWGIVVAEAMACARPVVTYALPVFPHIFENINLTAPLGDTAAFAAQVARLLADDGLRAELGARGRALVERRYSWSAVAEQEWGILRDAAGESPRQGEVP